MYLLTYCRVPPRMPTVKWPFSRWTWVSWFPLGFLPVIVLQEKLWRYMAQLFTGWMSCPSRNQQCQNHWRKPNALIPIRKITHWPHPFYIHHLTADKTDNASFMPVQQLNPLLIDWVEASRHTQHKIGHFGDVPQANLLAWHGKTKPNTTKAHNPQSKQMYYNTK